MKFNNREQKNEEKHSGSIQTLSFRYMHKKEIIYRRLIQSLIQSHKEDWEFLIDKKGKKVSDVNFTAGAYPEASSAFNWLDMPYLYYHFIVNNSHNPRHLRPKKLPFGLPLLPFWNGLYNYVFNI